MRKNVLRPKNWLKQSFSSEGVTIQRPLYILKFIFYMRSILQRCVVKRRMQEHKSADGTGTLCPLSGYAFTKGCHLSAFTIPV